MRIRFNLRDASASSKTPIYLIARYRGNTLKWSTGQYIKPSQWDLKRQRPKAGKLHHLRNFLNRIEITAEKIYLEANSGSLTVAQFREQLDIASGKKAPEDEKTPFLIEYATTYVIGKRKGLTTVKNSLSKFLNGKDIRFDEIDWNFRKRYVDHLKVKNFQLSTINKRLAGLAQFINASRKDGHHNNTISLEGGWKIKVKGSTSAPIALSLEELKKIAVLPLKGTEKKVADLFLIGAMTGQRWSDYSAYRPENFRGGQLVFRQQKTKEIIEIDLDMFDGLLPETLTSIMERYGYHSPGVSAQLFNQTIKALCKRAGITQKVMVTSRPGGEIRDEYYQKWEKISSHTARRTFATIWYEKGLSAGEIMLVTGHKSEKMLRAYIGITEQQARQRMRKNVLRLKENILAKIA